MIGPVSTTGRTMMASLQQAIQKGMPPDQAIQYVKSMATQGVAPLADLYAMMNQFQRLKQQPVQPPQTPPTIKDQLNALEQQQAMMQQGVASLPAPAMEQAQFAGGGIVAFSGGGIYDVEGIYERGKPDRGDIFDPRKLSIFAERADVEDLARLYALSLSKEDVDTASRLEPHLMRKGVSSSQLNEIRRKTAQGVSSVREANEAAQEANEAAQEEAETQQFLTGQAPQAEAAPPAPPPEQMAPPVGRPAPSRPAIAAARPATVPAQQTEDFSAAGMLNKASEGAEEIAKWQKAQGIGQADEEMRSFLSEENERLTKQFGQDKMLAFAEAGFRMAAAASRPGATFLGALSEGAISGTQALRGLQKEMDANRRGLRESMIKLSQAEEARKEGRLDMALRLEQQGRAEFTQRQQFQQKLAVDYKQIEVAAAGVAASRENAAATREATAAAQGERAFLERQRLVQNALKEDSAYNTLGMQLAALDPDKDADKIATIQSRRNAIERQAEARAGLGGLDAASGQGFNTRYRYDSKTGQMIPIE